MITAPLRQRVAGGTVSPAQDGAIRGRIGRASSTLIRETRLLEEGFILP